MKRVMGSLLTVIIFLMVIQPICAKPNDEQLKRLVLTLLAPGAPVRLSSEQQEQLKQTIVNSVPHDVGFTVRHN